MGEATLSKHCQFGMICSENTDLSSFRTSLSTACNMECTACSIFPHNNRFQAQERAFCSACTPQLCNSPVILQQIPPLLCVKCLNSGIRQSAALSIQSELCEVNDQLEFAAECPVMWGSKRKTAEVSRGTWKPLTQSCTASAHPWKRSNGLEQMTSKTGLWGSMACSYSDITRDASFFAVRPHCTVALLSRSRWRTDIYP